MMALREGMRAKAPPVCTHLTYEETVNRSLLAIALLAMDGNPTNLTQQSHVQCCVCAWSGNFA